MIYLQLFYTFFKIGLFGFGGGYAMLSMMIGAILNIILDPIFHLCCSSGCVEGAAIATIISQLFGLLFNIAYLFRLKRSNCPDSLLLLISGLQEESQAWDLQAGPTT